MKSLKKRIEKLEKKPVESNQIWFVKFSHWRNSKKEQVNEMYLYSAKLLKASDVLKWINTNFSSEMNPIIWEVKFVSWGYSLDVGIDEQDF